MTSINALQNTSLLAQLLAAQQKALAAAPQQSQSLTSQSGGGDSLSLSSAALQALQSQGLDPTQLQQASQNYPTYKSQGHHHHHHGAQAPQGGSSQAPSADSPAQVSQVGQAENAPLQAKS